MAEHACGAGKPMRDVEYPVNGICCARLEVIHGLLEPSLVLGHALLKHAHRRLQGIFDVSLTGHGLCT
jgi:hypothetical protein